MRTMFGEGLSSQSSIFTALFPVQMVAFALESVYSRALMPWTVPYLPRALMRTVSGR